jgi:mono/diheme cytochrome c family protein
VKNLTVTHNPLGLTLLGLTLALSLGACAVKSNASNNTSPNAKTGAYSLAPVEHSASEAQYDWKAPQYPADYKVDPLDKPFLSGRTLGPGGSYAGPWIEGEEANLMPVANPNVNLGDELIGKIDPSKLPALNIEVESPFMVFLNLRKSLEGVLIDSQAIGKEELWSITMALYRKAEVDWRTPVPVLLDPTSKTNPKNQKAGNLTFGNCNMCHGADGWGAGHSGLRLQPKPANFHEPHRLYNRADGKLWGVLQNGVYGSAMPQWRDKLSIEEIKSVVAYVRGFSYSTDPLPAKKPAAMLEHNELEQDAPILALGGQK